MPMWRPWCVAVNHLPLAESNVPSCGAGADALRGLCAAAQGTLGGCVEDPNCEQLTGTSGNAAHGNLGSCSSWEPQVMQLTGTSGHAAHGNPGSCSPREPRVMQLTGTWGGDALRKSLPERHSNACGVTCFDVT
eukprot:364241-Chlamydomonas_euryale.AAC.13